MRIKALSQATGADVETIRFYEKQGLLSAPARSDNGYRDYDTPHLGRLSFIRHCRALDMPLPAVKRLLALLDNPSGHCLEVDQLIEEQLRRVQARLDSMRALAQQLTQLRATCRGAQDGRECGILQELVAAAHGEACACHPA